MTAARVHSALILTLLLPALFGPISRGVAQTLPESQLREIGLLAVQDDGRRKPLDTFARESLLFLTGRKQWKAFGVKWSPTAFLMSALLEEREWRKQPMLLVSSSELKEKLGLDKLRSHFSLEELGNCTALRDFAKAIHEKQVAEQPLDRLEKEGETVAQRMALFQNILVGRTFLIVPARGEGNTHWQLPPDYSSYYSEAEFQPAMEQLRTLATAYIGQDAFAIPQAARKLRETLRGLSPAVYPEEKTLEIEYFYNHLQAFHWAAIFFLAGFVLVCAAAIRTTAPESKWLRRAGIISGVAGVVLETAGIILRCVISGRPPVTNMFESVIWVSFVVGVLGFVFYAIYRSDLYLLAALPVSALSVLLVLQLPAAMPANIDPLVPVLRDNFWLTIHVLTIVMSYGAFALAMAFGHIVLGMYVFKPAQTSDDLALHFWLYRVIQLGVLLLGAGTILGGVWANYSWGRFWGWDPKETWALIALLGYIVALHGRIAGWWGHFGMAVASVVCFLSIIMAWYGVNFLLGKGLHSYGFGVGGEKYMIPIVLADFVFVLFAGWRHLSAKRLRQAAKGATEEEVRLPAR